MSLKSFLLNASINSIYRKLRYRDWKRTLRFFKQRRTRGWDDSETFSLDHSLAKVILPRLKRFREVTIATPASLDEKEWKEILDEMIETFEFIASEKYWNATSEDYERLSKGLDLFAKHYFGLWW
jgi:hypothetical protein